MNRTNDSVIIAHDYLCPWCWIGLFQAKRLKDEFPDLRQDWRGFELLPESLGPIPDYRPQPKDTAAAPSRLDMLAVLDGIAVPEKTIGIVRTHDALQGAEYFKEYAPDAFDTYNEGVYRAYWERSEDISSVEVLTAIAVAAGADHTAFADAIRKKRYSSRIIPYDDPAYALDITHVPTFVFRGERCAEAPYATIREMALRFQAWYVNQ